MAPPSPVLEGTEGGSRESDGFTSSKVQCLECGSQMSMLTVTHLRKCSGLSLKEYGQKHPGADTVSEDVKTRRNASVSESKKGKSRGPCERHRGFMRDRWKDPAYKEEMTRMAQQVGARPDIRSFRSLKMSRYYLDHPEHRGKVSVTAKEWAALHPEKKRAAGISGHEALAKSRRPSSIETALRVALDGAGIAYHYQWRYSLGVADFKIGDLIVFADGTYWHNFPHGTDKDRRQTEHLKSLGFTVLRLWEHDINRDPMACLDRIRQLVADKERENHVG